MNDKTTQNVSTSVFGEQANHIESNPSALLALLAICMTAAVLVLQPSWPAVAGIMSMNGMVAVVCLVLIKENRK